MVEWLLQWSVAAMFSNQATTKHYTFILLREFISMQQILLQVNRLLANNMHNVGQNHVVIYPLHLCAIRHKYPDRRLSISGVRFLI